MARLRNGQSFPKKEEEEEPPPPPPWKKRAAKRVSNAAHEEDKPETRLTPPLPTASGKRKRASKRATSTGVQDDDVKPETKKPTPAAGKGKGTSKRSSTGEQEDKRAVAKKREVTVEDTNALNCGICFLPLKPPIFEVNHKSHVFLSQKKWMHMFTNANPSRCRRVEP